MIKDTSFSLFNMAAKHAVEGYEAFRSKVAELTKVRVYPSLSLYLISRVEGAEAGLFSELLI